MKSGCFGIAILVIGILCFLLGLAGCLAEDFLAGSIAIIQGILFFFAWLLMTGRIQKAKLKFWVPLVAALILITFIPQISLWLPNLLMHYICPGRGFAPAGPRPRETDVSIRLLFIRRYLCRSYMISGMA